MTMKRRFLIMILAAALFAAAAAGCGILNDAPPKAAEDEILLEIQLDLKEDIGLLILDIDLDGAETAGGVSNADKTLLKHNELLYWTLNKSEYDHPGDSAELRVRFRIVTEYCEPNYDNIYPEESVVLLDPLSFSVNFGKSYSFTITGSRDKGYRAELKQP